MSHIYIVCHSLVTRSCRFVKTHLFRQRPTALCLSRSADRVKKKRKNRWRRWGLFPEASMARKRQWKGWHSASWTLQMDTRSRSCVLQIEKTGVLQLSCNCLSSKLCEASIEIMVEEKFWKAHKIQSLVRSQKKEPPQRCCFHGNRQITEPSKGRKIDLEKKQKRMHVLRLGIMKVAASARSSWAAIS